MSNEGSGDFPVHRPGGGDDDTRREVLHPELVDGPASPSNPRPDPGFSDVGAAYPSSFGLSSGGSSGLDGGSVVAFLFALSAWSVFPVVGAIPSLFFAFGAKRRIRHSNGTLAGYTLATAAQFIAAAALALAALIFWLLVRILRLIF